MHKKPLILSLTFVVSIAGALFLSGCAGGPVPTTLATPYAIGNGQNGWDTTKVQIDTGQTVTCYTRNMLSSSSLLTCDWDSLKDSELADVTVGDNTGDWKIKFLSNGNDIVKCITHFDFDSSNSLIDCDWANPAKSF